MYLSRRLCRFRISILPAARRLPLRRFNASPKRLKEPPKQSTDPPPDDPLPVYSYFVRFLLAYGFTYCTSQYFFLITQCEGPSMLPTMDHDGEIVLVDRWTCRRYGIQGGSTAQEQRLYNKRLQRQHSNKEEWNESLIPVNQFPPEGRWERFWHTLSTGISRGDLVVAQHPEKEGTVCKRVIGLPGDEIIRKQSQYTRDHFVGRSRRDTRKQRKYLQKVPDGHVWLEGDNSRNSRDSRNYGPVPAALILGRAPLRIWRVFPFGREYLLERGMPPKAKKGAYKYDAQASKVIPAGYEGQRFVQKYRRKKGE